MVHILWPHMYRLCVSNHPLCSAGERSSALTVHDMNQSRDSSTSVHCMFQQSESKIVMLRKRTERLSEMQKGMAGIFAEAEKSAARSAYDHAVKDLKQAEDVLLNKRKVYEAEIVSIHGQLEQRRRYLAKFDDVLKGHPDLGDVMLKQHTQLQHRMDAACTTIVD